MRLLARENASLLDLTLNSHLGACRGNGIVPAAISPNASVADARALGRTESANRAAEVIEIRADGLPDSERAKALANGVSRISGALQGIWVDGVRLIGGLMRVGSAEFRRDVVRESTRLLSAGADQTTAVLLATVACEFPDTQAATLVVNALLKALPDLPRECSAMFQLTSASVQELGMLALVAQLALLPQKERGQLANSVLRALDELKTRSVKHIAKVGQPSVMAFLTWKRCTQISLLIERELLDKLKGKKSLEDVLDAVMEAYAEAIRGPPSASSPGLSNNSVEPRKRGTGLKYTYDQSTAESSGLTGSMSCESPSPRSREKGKGNANGSRSPLERAAELADFKAMGRSMLMAEELVMDELRLGGR